MKKHSPKPVQNTSDIKKTKHQSHIKKEAEPGMAPKVKRSLALLLFIVGVVLYINTANHGYVLDDFSIIKENVITTKGTEGISTLLKTSYRYGYFNISDGLYRPLSVIMFAVEWELWPDNPYPSHVINILLYGFTGVLSFLFLLRCFPLLHPVISFTSVLLFLVHPIHTEVVANIKSRDEIICFLFSIGVLYMAAKEEAQTRFYHLILMIILFVLALLSKETAITVIPLAMLTLWYKGSTMKNSLKIMIPLAITAGIYLLIRKSILQSTLGVQNISTLDNLLLSAPDMASRIATAIKILGMYVYKLIIPHPLIFDYSYRSIDISTFGDIRVIGSLLLYLGAGIVSLRLMIKRDPLGYGILFYLIGIGLFSNIFFLVGTAMAERFAYFASFGFCFSICYMIFMFTTGTVNKQFHTSLLSVVDLKKIPVLFILGVSMIYSIRTMARNKDWKDNMTLYSHDVPVQYNSARAHYYLGNEIIKTVAPNEQDPAKKLQLFSQGIKELEKTLEIYPADQDAHTQLGVAYHRMNEFDKAAEHYNISLKYNPKDVITLNNLAGVYFAKGNFKDAINIYKTVIQENPRYYDAWLNLGSAYGMTGQYQLAVDHFLQASSIRPDLPQPYQYLAITYKNMGDLKKAAEFEQKLQSLNQ